MSKILEYRGVSDLVYAEVTEDTLENYTTGAVKPLAGVATITRETASSSEAHYYDNQAAIVISTVGADTVTCTVSAIPLDVLADLTGQNYDEATGVLIEGHVAPKYFAIGYKTKKTNGDEVYVWRHKVSVGIPSVTHSTENDGTEANGQELVFTGVATTHRFAKADNKGIKAINVDVALGKADVTTFFDEVTTPDSLKAKA